MDIFHRRDALLNWLRARGTATAAEAAEAFGVSTRTILRDVAVLREHGEPIESDAGRGGGLRVDALRSLAPVRLRLEEVVGLFLWVELSRLSGPVSAIACTQSGIEAMMSALPGFRAMELRRFVRGVVVRPGVPMADPPGPGRAGVLAAVERTASARRLLRATDASSGRAWRVEVHGLIVEPPYWWVAVRDPATDEVSRLRIDRLVDVEVDEDTRVSVHPTDAVLARLGVARPPGGRRVAPDR